jgi:hypothetical protein
VLDLSQSEKGSDLLSCAKGYSVSFVFVKIFKKNFLDLYASFINAFSNNLVRIVQAHTC